MKTLLKAFSDRTSTKLTIETGIVYVRLTRTAGKHLPGLRIDMFPDIGIMVLSFDRWGRLGLVIRGVPFSCYSILLFPLPWLPACLPGRHAYNGRISRLSCMLYIYRLYNSSRRIVTKNSEAGILTPLRRNSSMPRRGCHLAIMRRSVGFAPSKWRVVREITTCRSRCRQGLKSVL